MEFTPKSIAADDNSENKKEVIAEEPTDVKKEAAINIEIKTEPRYSPPPLIIRQLSNHVEPLVEVKDEKVEQAADENESKNDIVSPAQMKQQQPVSVDTELLTSIKGFEEWTRSMIKDFIDCMGKARQKYNTLKEQNPNTDVRQVAMLLDEWKLVYPESRETVQSFVDKVRHLKAQKELIKKHLGNCHICCCYCLFTKYQHFCLHTFLAQPEKPSMTPEGKPFKWSPEMMPDVIESRQRAFELKQDEEKSNGRKLSHNSLWEAEFKKIYPNSNFTSNNLSVHFWTWKKKQQKLAKKQGIPGMYSMYMQYMQQHSAVSLLLENVNKQICLQWKVFIYLSFAVKEVINSNPLTKKVSVQNPIRDTIAREELLSVGRKVEQMLQNPETPNELKLQGFANVLHEEWRKDHPDSSESSRSLNMMYSRLLR